MAHFDVTAHADGINGFVCMKSIKSIDMESHGENGARSHEKEGGGSKWQS